MKNVPKIIIALDFEPKVGTTNILSIAENYQLGVKIGLPFFLEAGADKVKRLLNEFDVFAIADFKLADVGFVMCETAKKLKNIGFSGLIAHGFVGAKKAITDLRNITRELDLRLYVVVAMSHPGAEEILNKNFEEILSLAKAERVDGIIAPATMPHYIVKARKELGEDFEILSPGVGAQGALPGTAIKNGADAEIIGRMITKADNPEEVVRKLIEVYG